MKEKDFEFEGELVICPRAWRCEIRPCRHAVPHEGTFSCSLHYKIGDCPSCVRATPENKRDC